MSKTTKKGSTLPGLDKAQQELASRGINLPPQTKPAAPKPEAPKLPPPKRVAGEDKEEIKLRSLCGMSTDFQVGTRVVELHPVLVKDWPEFSKNLFILEHETLYEIFMYGDGSEILWETVKVICRTKEVPPLFEELTQLDYRRFREIVLEQNDINFEEVRDKKRKKMEELRSLGLLASQKE